METNFMAVKQFILTIYLRRTINVQETIQKL